MSEQEASKVKYKSFWGHLQASQLLCCVLATVALADLAAVSSFSLYIFLLFWISVDETYITCVIEKHISTGKGGTYYSMSLWWFSQFIMLHSGLLVWPWCSNVF